MCESRVWECVLFECCMLLCTAVCCGAVVQRCEDVISDSDVGDVN